MSNSKIIEREYAQATKGIKDVWFTTVNSDWYNYIINLPIHLQMTYVVITFRDQIFNGGFHQYFVNGYGQFARETIDALNTIGAVNKMKLLKEALQNVNYENDRDIIFRKRLLEKDIYNLFINDNLYKLLDQLDSQFYLIEKEDEEQLLEAYLLNR